MRRSLSDTVAAILALGSAEQAFGADSLVSFDPGSVAFYTSMRLDSLGRPVISYEYGPTANLRLMHCGDPECTSGTIQSPETAGAVGTGSSLRLDAAGNPVISHYHNTNDDLSVVHCGDPNCSSGNSIAYPDTTGDVGAGTSIVLDAAGRPVVAYYDRTNSALKVLHCGNANCTSGNSIATPDNTAQVGLSPTIALDAAGNPVVAHWDLTNGDIRIVHCGNANCTSGNSSVSPDPVGTHEGHTHSLVLDGSGRPVVAYTDTATDDLKVLHCGNPNCTAGNSITTPDTGDVFGGSIALDASGFPVVAYRNITTGALLILHCGDANCASGNSIKTAATGVGAQPTLVLDAAGHPVVSFRDDVSIGPMLLHCDDANCADDDDDGVPDAADNCPLLSNPGQANHDLDPDGDACDLDDDNDGLPDTEEIAQGSDPLDADGDEDGFCDGPGNGDGGCSPDDNCPFVSNDTQDDNDAAPAGDACQCGDVADADGIDATDVLRLREALVERSPSGPYDGGRCDVNGDSECDVADIFELDRFVAGEATSIENACPAYAP